MDLLCALSSFARVVETGSFSRTARETGLSQTVITRQIAHLEQHFGVRLLHRTTRQLSLTYDGQVLVEHAQRLLQQSSAMEQEIAAHRDVPSGLVRLGSIKGAGLFLASRLPDLLHRHPGLAVQLTSCDQLGEMVESRLDLALCHGSFTDSSFVVRHIASFKCAIVAAPAYVKRYNEPETPADLERHICIRQDGEGDCDLWSFDGPEGPVSVRASGRLLTSNGFVALSMARDGCGVACLPHMQVRDDLRDGRLVRLLGRYQPKPLMLYAAYPTKRLFALRTRAVLDFLVEQGRSRREAEHCHHAPPIRAAVREQVALPLCVTAGENRGALMN